MKTRTMVYLMVLGLFATQSAAQADRPTRTAGLGVRGSSWDMNRFPDQSTVSVHTHMVEVSSGSGGGWLFFISRMSESDWVEISLGAAGKAEVTDATLVDETQVDGVSTVLLGFRHELFAPANHSRVRPYAAWGIGPYWVHRIHAIDRAWVQADEEVQIDTRLKGGGYLGGGINLMLSSVVGINVDARYHFIEFDRKNDFSGLDFGLGLMICWGRFR